MLNANDENGADKTNRYGKDIPDGDAFPQKNGPQNQHENRCQIINGNGDGYGHFFKRFKQKHPVQNEKNPAKQCLNDLF